ncbi:M3 family oligoendopeptidase [Tepidibacillus infernus]|uniref:Oligoendopeptidase F n=1 Tax=Tepidibacillus decaturensis TaxID=1413211 RepID=A0A135L1G2_9BACI|nr:MULTISPECIES: M3 family oligoendopeptidase [Tepidibacillus]KXG42727.1 oligoendopeptidase F [Tepidibacillus decaturensis]GBF10690.1 oligoendopeptidase F, plasmid [Tepidibacillus sp. HK-1]
MSSFFIEKISFQDPKEVETKLETLLKKEIHSTRDLENWLREESQLFDEIDEILTGHYIEFQGHNDDEEIRQRFEHDQNVITPIIKKYEALLDKRFYDNPYREQLDTEKYSELIKRRVNSIEIFREENIPLEVQEQNLSTEYYKVTGNMTVEWEGEAKTLQQMSIYLKDPDRSIREKAWKLVQARRLEDKDKLDEIMDQLVKIRHQIALNAGFENYRDYMFKKYERFSYTPEDTYQFHEAVQKYVVPLKDEIEKEHQKELGLKDYRPWDLTAVKEGDQPLKPFTTTDELVDGVTRIFRRTDSNFAKMLEDMNDHHTLDLDSRKAKSPGGFCAPLSVSNRSFIFMNASGTHDDMTTLVHEGGHSVHNLFKSQLDLRIYKSTPMESAEFASMGMELLSMDKWDEFYKNDEDLKKAKREQLEGIIKFLPWAMTIDKFQHWIYLNPEHSAEERNDQFKEIALSLSQHYEDWSGYEEELRHRWKAQLHIYEVPFYYIEYAIAQLGAVQIWKQYKENPEQALANYKKALSLGSSRPLPEIYEAAGIKFDFSEAMIKELMEFVREELNQLGTHN